MGKGSGTGQKGVVKPKLKHVVGDGGGSSALGGDVESDNTPKNICLFSLGIAIKLSGGIQKFNRGDRVTLTQIKTDEVGVFVNNQRVSSYNGQDKNKLLKCMGKGYVYSGIVQSIGANTLRAVVAGGVLSYASA